MFLTYFPPTFIMIESKTRIKDKCELSIDFASWDRSIEIKSALIVLQHETFQRGRRMVSPITAALQTLLSVQDY